VTSKLISQQLQYNSTQCCSRPPAGTTVGLCDWCTAIWKNMAWQLMC